ncbi:hypothetical protein TIFTF001_026439 [Ficus carica]|uniref:Uncharacterized protein n=1 Tax=Ficus carica TaxID=3494 RepID=A0AA88DL75_FICCA|nr:hypothetical protein TIFTF001_026439 [Ficus carica]
MDGLRHEVNLESGTSAIAPTDTDVSIDQDKEEELEVISEDPTNKAKRKRRTTSIVWSHIDKLPLTEDKRFSTFESLISNNKSIHMDMDEIIEDVLNLELNESSSISAQSSHNPSSSNAEVPMEG